MRDQLTRRRLLAIALAAVAVGCALSCLSAGVETPRLAEEAAAAQSARKSRSTKPASDGVWQAGVARIDITPEFAVWMAGYGARTNPASGRRQNLYAKALALKDPAGKRLVLLTTDLVGMQARFTAGLAEELKTKHGLARDQLMFTSSHTHSGPVLADALDNSVWYPLTPAHEQSIRRYTQLLRGQLLAVVNQALTELKPARLAWGISKAGFAVNRREPTPNGIINGTNAFGPVDHDVPILRVESPDGELRAVAFGYACHNTTLGDYLWCGDYAGYAQEYFEQAHPGATGLFFMGCGADANPLPRRTVELCQKYGRQLADAVEAALKYELRPITGQAFSGFENVNLPLDKLPTREELEAQAQGKPSYTQRRAVMLLKVLDQNGRFATRYPYPVQVWQLGPQLTWVALGGEAVVDYSHRLKRELGASTWVASYANDVMAYIPSLRVLQEGGYEATITSGELAGSCWGPQTEENIIHQVHKLVAQVRGVGAAQALRIGVENSLTKVFCDEPFTGKISETLELAAARNEYEAGQVVLLAGPDGLEKVSLEFSDLVHEGRKGTIPRTKCAYNFVGYTAPTSITAKDVLANRKMAESKPQRYPDPLLVDVTRALQPNSVQPIWVTIYVPAQTPAGRYSGTISIKTGDQTLAKVNFKLHVWDFTLPESTPQYVWFYNDFNSFVNNWLEVSPAKWDAYKTAFRHYAREIARHRGSIGLPLRYDAPGFDELMQIAIDEGLEFWWVTWLWGKDYVEADLETQKRMAKQVYDAMKQKGLLDATFFVTWDEPDLQPQMEQNRAKWKQHISVLKDLGFPKRQVEMTWRCQTATALMEPYPTVWCPQYSYFDKLYYDFLQKRRQAGDIVGFYLTGSGNGQEPRHYLPFSLTEMRRLNYYLWHHGLRLCEFWALDIKWRKTGADPFSMVVGSAYGGGTDALVYPNPQKDLTRPFLSSLRLEAIRDGIEDYCYLWLLDKLVARAREQGALALADTGAKVLTDVSGRFGQSLRDYHLTNATDYLEARKTLADTILKLKVNGPEVAFPRKTIGRPKPN